MFAAQAAMALTNADTYAASLRLASELRDALDSRAVIDQAIGILIGQDGYSQDLAFETLRITSQSQNASCAMWPRRSFAPPRRPRRPPPSSALRRGGADPPHRAEAPATAPERPGSGPRYRLRRPTSSGDRSRPGPYPAQAAYGDDVARPEAQGRNRPAAAPFRTHRAGNQEWSAMYTLVFGTLVLTTCGDRDEGDRTPPARGAA